MDEEQKEQLSFCQRHVGSIALIVGILALGSSLVPQIQNFFGSGNVEVTVVKAEGAKPAPGPGPGPRGGFGGGPAPVSEETLKLYAERIRLYDAAIKATTQQAEQQWLRHERCLVRLAKARLEQGGRRPRGASLAELFLTRQALAVRAGATALEQNQAALDYQRALDQFRGDREAFLGTVSGFENYPARDLTDEELIALLAAERG